jgi:hypothetical protein
MVAITATSYATPPSQAWQGRARLDQAQEAAKGQDKVRAVSAQVAQSDSTYSSTLRQQIAATQSRRAQGTLAPVATVAANGFAFSSNPLSKGVFF